MRIAYVRNAMLPRLFCCVLLLVACGDCLSQPKSAAPNARQEEVRQKGAQVMPFALDRTVHVFDKTGSGGVQSVLLRGADPEQLAMIRSHLQEIVKAFTARDFSKPMHIHGTDMPGLAELQAANAGDLITEYKELADGAQITYLSHSPKVVAAIHRWFDAQVSDHGDDAMSHDKGPVLNRNDHDRQ
jgi:hypothetical protein